MRSRSLFINKEKGFSLVEVMVALAVLAGIATGSMSLFQNMNKNSTKGKQDSDMLIATNEMAALLSDPENCKATLPNLSTNPTNIKFIHPTSGVMSKYATGSQFGNVGTKISGYRIIYPLDGNNEQARLIINYEKKKVLGTGDFSRKLDLYVLADATAPFNTIHCRSVATNDELWKRGTSPHEGDIHFGGGVGIGTTTPQTMLSVHATGTRGGIAVESEAQANVSIRGFSDTGNTYAALYMGKDNVPFSTSSWGLAFKKNTANAEGFNIFHSSTAAAFFPTFSITPGHRFGFLTDDPQGTVHIVQPDVSPAIAPMGLVVDSPTAQGNILIRGKSDSNLTHAAVYFGKENTVAALNTWFVGYFGPAQAPYDGFVIGRNGVGHAISITADAMSVGFGTGNPDTNYRVHITETGGKSLKLDGDFLTAGNSTMNGNVTVGGTVTAASDKRLKNKVKPLKDSLKKILKLHGISFHWIDQNRGEGPQIGFIAQDVEKVYPELVHTDEEGNKSVAYQNLVAPLVEAIHAQQEQIESLKAELEESQGKQELMMKELCLMNPKFSFCRK